MQPVETLVALRAPLAPAHGTPGLAQSRYGARGNLELVVPDPVDGLWVYWRNTDAADVRPGAVAGGWSAGLHFAAGRRYDHAAVLQTRHGPEFVEVLAGADGQVDRTYWSPGAGFSPPEPAFAGDGPLRLDESPDEPWALRASAGGAVFEADVSAYPQLRWVAGGTAPEPCPSVAFSLLDDEVEVIGGNGFSACRSTLDGGRIEVVVRRGTQLLHCAVDAAGRAVVEPLQVVETHAWVVPPEEPCRS